MSILTFILGVPLAAALVLALVPRNYRVVMRAGAIFATLVSAVLAIIMFALFNGAPADADGFKFACQIPWVDTLGISYHLGVDGINVGLVLMGAIVALAAACVSWEIREREKEFYILLLIMAGGILGAFASLDLFLFYFFHELALVPTFIMIGVCGRGEQKNYATFQITLYLSIGALIALIGLIALYLQAGAGTFDIPKLAAHLRQNPLSPNAQNLIFPLLLFGFGILVSLWPFHSWAPMGYASAPSATAMLHAGVLKKFGLYGLIRIALPMLPDAAQSWMQIVAWLCLGNLVYCGWVAMRQRDFNWLVGYSSVAHMGFVFLGIATLNLVGVTGAVLVMIAHGFLAALTFGLTGYIYQQTGTLQMDQLGGLLRKLPFIGAALMMAAFAGCGLPGFANFAGEATVFFGAWKPFRLVTVFACWGALIIGAVYLLRAIRAILQGPLPEKWAGVADAHWWRKAPFVLLLAGLFVFGFLPSLLTDKIQPSVETILPRASMRAGNSENGNNIQTGARSLPLSNPDKLGPWSEDWGALTRSLGEPQYSESSSPSPLPSPFGRGRIAGCRSANRELLEFSRAGLGCSLSPRERVGVRGKGSYLFPAPPEMQVSQTAWQWGWDEGEGDGKYLASSKLYSPGEVPSANPLPPVSNHNPQPAIRN